MSEEPRVSGNAAVRGRPEERGGGPPPAEPAPPEDPIPDLIGVLRRQGRLPKRSGALTRIAALPPSRREAALLAEELVTEEDIARAVAADTGFPFCAINAVELNPEVVTGALPAPFARRHTICALSREEGALTVAMANPYLRGPISDLERYLGVAVKVVVATRSDIQNVNTSLYNLRASLQAAETQLWEEHGPTSDPGAGAQEFASAAEDLEPTTRPVVTALDSILRQAFEQRASDIHIEPKRDFAVVRFRVDGVLQTMHRFPRIVHQAVVSRIKMLSGLDIAEKRRPQDGRMKRVGPGTEIELRVSTLSTLFGEKAVLRVFDPASLVSSLEQVRLAHDEERRLRSILNRREGLVLVTGPTGSGKTTTLYAVLRHLATSEVNVVTIEDPVELTHAALNQVQVNARIGFHFAAAIRSVLRQDPDIVMVGEIRDGETAEMAVQAALTGHLVLSTLHTNDAPGAVTRLVDLGVPRFLIASTLVGVVAQRLIRTVCPRCSEWTTLTATQAEVIAAPALEGRRLRDRRGCARCGETGYRGRRGIFEIIEVDGAAAAAIMSAEGAARLSRLARKAGFRSLRQNALVSLLEGETTLAEVVRVTGAGRDPGGGDPADVLTPEPPDRGRGAGSVAQGPPEEQEEGRDAVEREDDVGHRCGPASHREPGEETGGGQRDLPQAAERIDDPDADQVEQQVDHRQLEAEVSVGTGDGERREEGGDGGPDIGAERHREGVLEEEEPGPGERHQHGGGDRTGLDEDRGERPHAHGDESALPEHPLDGVLGPGGGEALERPDEEAQRDDQERRGGERENGGGGDIGGGDHLGDPVDDAGDPVDQRLQGAVVIDSPPDEALEPAGDDPRGPGEDAGGDFDGQQDRDRDQVEHVVAGGDREGPSELVAIPQVPERGQRVRDCGPQIGAHDHGDRALERKRRLRSGDQGDDERTRDRGALDERRREHSDEKPDEGVFGSREEAVQKPGSEPLQAVTEPRDRAEEQDEQAGENQRAAGEAEPAGARPVPGHQETAGTTNFRFVMEE